ncbi:hypothetical protein GGF46_002123 [Coemansia sp. RSA 552]|nr:hypothetical protein GGF46_002123 [Coemansia sp. RSA 552]
MFGHSAGTVVTLLVLSSVARAHTYITNIYVNGTEMDEGKCVKPFWDDTNYPVMDPNSKDLVCRAADQAADDTDECGVTAGDTITVEIHDEERDTIAIAEGHNGPCMVYMSPYSQMGDEPTWFKIYEAAYFPDKDRWCIDDLIDSKGKWDITIPEDIKPGPYWLRAEIISLHEAERVYGEDESAGAQYYPMCVRINVSGSGTSVPKGVSIPGLYSPTEKGINFNIYNGKKGSSTYTIPGPPVYKPGSTSAIGSGPTPVPETPIEKPVEEPVEQPIVKPPGKSCANGKTRKTRNRRRRRRRQNREL